MMSLRQFVPYFLVCLVLGGSLAHAQGMNLGFGGLSQDPTAPVEVDADELSVDQAQSQAVFKGNVRVVQGNLRLAAGQVRVEYGDDGQGIRKVHASGGVLVSTEKDAAESQSASYDIQTGGLVMEGEVLLTQGQMAISGDRLVADLRAGTGRMEGRVRTVLQTGGN
jgi:lipopolysaccharide export system protein LptA